MINTNTIEIRSSRILSKLTVYRTVRRRWRTKRHGFADSSRARRRRFPFRANCQYAPESLSLEDLATSERVSQSRDDRHGERGKAVANENRRVEGCAINIKIAPTGNIRHRHTSVVDYFRGGSGTYRAFIKRVLFQWDYVYVQCFFHFFSSCFYQCLTLSQSLSFHSARSMTRYTYDALCSRRRQQREKDD